MPDAAATYLGLNEVQAILITAGVAAAIAIWGIFTQRLIAARQATFEHITNVESDNDLLEAQRQFITLAKQPGGLAIWAEPDKEGTKEEQSIRLTLNEFELASVAIQRGIMDFAFYRAMYRSTVIRYWTYAAPYVHALRAHTQVPVLFAEFEALAMWMQPVRPRSRNFFWGRFF